MGIKTRWKLEFTGITNVLKQPPQTFWDRGVIKEEYRVKKSEKWEVRSEKWKVERESRIKSQESRLKKVRG